MVTDLRTANKVIQPMSSLQSGYLCLLSYLVIDFKDCFFTIPLQEKDREKISFAVSTYNNSQSTKRYQWEVLPQGLLNSTTCVNFFKSATGNDI